jgi:hypothetical protein
MILVRYLNVTTPLETNVEYVASYPLLPELNTSFSLFTF